MTKNTTIGLLIISAAILAGIYFAISASSPAATQTANNGEAMMEAEGTAMVEESHNDSAMMEGDDAMMMAEDGAMMEKEGGTIAQSEGMYAPYSEDKLALAESGDVVLFFKASWCPSCRALDNDIKKNLGDIPAGVTILEVDFDDSRELKQKYGVTSQHTLVQVDANGDLVKKWLGGNTLNATLAQIN